MTFLHYARRRTGRWNGAATIPGAILSLAAVGSFAQPAPILFTAIVILIAWLNPATTAALSLLAIAVYVHDAAVLGLVESIVLAAVFGGVLAGATALQVRLPAKL